LAAQADGWYVRSMVIWAKPNPMPESVNGWRWERHQVKVGTSDEPTKESTNAGSLNSGAMTKAQWSDCPGCEKCSPNDGLVLRKGSWRPTDAYEHILMLTKTADYFGDAEAVKEAGSEASLERYKYAFHSKTRQVNQTTPEGMRDYLPGTRNLRNVWTFPTQPYPEAHFATFPERLPEICIKASTSDRGCCPKCGANWARVIEQTEEYRARMGGPGFSRDGDFINKGATASAYPAFSGERQITKGWRPSCQCDAGEPVPCTVMDPFGGSGTTARVALKLNRRAVSVDLAYHGLARKRTAEIQPQLLMT
jgi:DNA methylase